MLFNSLYFAIFFVIVFILYWFVTNKNLKLQNTLLLFASCFFYACWDWRFLFLLLVSIGLVYYPGKFMSASTNQTHRKIWLWLSIAFSLGFLGIFKYYNFFVESFSGLISNFGFKLNLWSIKVILPVGISFYTFHGLSYIIDLYFKKLEEEKSFINYALFVSFFPLLVAGPIERATHLLPQIKKKRSFDYSKAVDGLKQILWGLFKKVVIADNCSEFENLFFNNSNDYAGSVLVLGAIFFSFQIYCDFSGYSDIALGIARLLGIELLQNFAFPYFARDIAEFWRRWHISLTTWFRDYIYIPLGGSRVGKWTKIRNTFIIFLVSGFWHGANWTFIVWGALNAFYFLPLMLARNNRKNIDIVAQGKKWPSINELMAILITFGLTTFAWIFFRANSIGHAISYISKIFSTSLFTIPVFKGKEDALLILSLIIIFILIEWQGRERKYAISHFGITWKKPFRHAMYYAIVLIIFWFSGKEQQFIYFQF